jgi:hypothetical protein
MSGKNLANLTATTDYQLPIAGPGDEIFTADIATESDIEEIYQFHGTVYEQNSDLIHPKTRAEIENLINNAGRTFVLRNQIGQIVCKKSLIIKPEPGAISGIERFDAGTVVFGADATIPDLQGHGLMTLLSKAVCDHLENCSDIKTGISEITLGNLSSLAQYIGRNGFVIDSTCEDPEDGTFVTIQKRDFEAAPLIIDHPEHWVPADCDGYSLDTVEEINHWLELDYRGVELSQLDGGKIGFARLSLGGLMRYTETENMGNHYEHTEL